MTQDIRKIEQETKADNVTIIAVTGAAMTGDEEHCLSIGMDDFISKPVHLDALKQVIQKWYWYDKRLTSIT